MAGIGTLPASISHRPVAGGSWPESLEQLFLRTLLERENVDTGLDGLRFGERVALLDGETIRD